MDIQVTFPGGLKVDAEVLGHVIKTDQAVQSGGDGSAPEPFLLFLASIGTCAGIYVLSFCRARDIPTDGIRIVESVERNPETKLVDKIGLEIQVPPSFPEKYRDALVKSANLCAVKKHLEKPPVITTTTKVV